MFKRSYATRFNLCLLWDNVEFWSVMLTCLSTWYRRLVYYSGIFISVLLSCQHDTYWREAESILWVTKQRAPLLESFFQIFVSYEFVRKNAASHTGFLRFLFIFSIHKDNLSFCITPVIRERNCKPFTKNHNSYRGGIGTPSQKSRIFMEIPSDELKFFSWKMCELFSLWWFFWPFLE